MIFNEELCLEFFKLAIERHAMHIKEVTGVTSPPFTNNIILQNNEFSTVFRRLDRVTQFIKEKVISPNVGHPQLWSAILLARYFNQLGIIDILHKEGCFFGGSTRTLNTLRKLKNKGVLKQEFIELNDRIHDSRYLPLIMNARIKDNSADFNAAMQQKTSLQQTTETLVKLSGNMIEYHYFFYQLALDFQEIPCYLGVLKDVKTYGVFSEEAIKGLCRLYNQDYLHINDDFDNIFEARKLLLKKWQGFMLNNMPNKALFGMFQNIEMADLIHWLEQYEKYKRIEGK